MTLMIFTKPRPQSTASSREHFMVRTVASREGVASRKTTTFRRFQRCQQQLWSQNVYTHLVRSRPVQESHLSACLPRSPLTCSRSPPPGRPHDPLLEVKPFTARSWMWNHMFYMYNPQNCRTANLITLPAKRTTVTFMPLCASNKQMSKWHRYISFPFRCYLIPLTIVETNTS